MPRQHSSHWHVEQFGFGGLIVALTACRWWWWIWASLLWCDAQREKEKSIWWNIWHNQLCWGILSFSHILETRLFEAWYLGLVNQILEKSNLWRVRWIQLITLLYIIKCHQIHLDNMQWSPSIFTLTRPLYKHPHARAFLMSLLSSTQVAVVWIISQSRVVGLDVIGNVL